MNFLWTDVSKDKKGGSKKEMKHSKHFLDNYHSTVINNGVAKTELVNLNALDKNEYELAFTNQISANIIAGQMATYFVCRDLAHAKSNLEEKTFDNVIKQIGKITNFSTSKIRKFLEVGKSDRLKKLYEQERLTTSWTTQYFLATCKQEDWNKIMKHKFKDGTLGITKDMSLTDIKKTFGLTNPSDELVVANIVCSKKFFDNLDKEAKANLLEHVPETVDDEHLTVNLSDRASKIIETQ